MHLTNFLSRLSNFIKFHNVPGNILIGKHRIWPAMTPRKKRYMLRCIDNEINTMKLISRPYFSEEESKEVYEEIKREEEEKKKKEKIAKIRANKNKIEDKYISDFLEPLRNHRVWE